jgi:hypothetical protein
MGPPTKVCGTIVAVLTGLHRAIWHGRVSTGADRCRRYDSAQERQLLVMVVVRFAQSDQSSRAYGVYLRLGIVNTCSRRSSDGSASPVMDRVLSGVPRTHPILR